MMNMGKMMKQLQQVQSKMAKMQEELADRTLESSSGGGAVRVKVSGKKELVEVNIDPEVLSEENKEMLEDMVLAAVNEAFKQVDDMVAAEMEKLTGGLNLPPGLF